MSDDPSDDDLVAAIRRRQRPLPPRLVDDAKALFTWRTVDRELAELLSDSLDLTAAVRSTASSVRHLEFGTPERGVRLDHLVVGRAIVGEVVGLRATTVTAERADGAAERAAVAEDRFQLTVRPGPVRFVLADGDVPVLVTEWVTLG